MLWGDNMVNQTKIYEILDEVKNLCEIIKRCEDEGKVNQELLVNWAYDALKLLGKLTKAVDELEERFELLEESIEK